MIKREELSNVNSCLNRAKDDELVFVLLGRDACAPAAIRTWAAERVRVGKNTWGDAQIIDALACIAEMSKPHALSLSSPIEPRIIECPDCGNKLEHKGGCIYMHREHPTPQASSEVREALAWALTKIEFPLVPDPSEEDRSWKGCPGCRVLWSRDMKHKTDCLYVNALALAPSRQGAAKRVEG